MTDELNLANTPGSASTSACLGIGGTLDFILDLRFGPIFFLASPWWAGDVTLAAMLPARK
jgi:hypothetical protein